MTFLLDVNVLIALVDPTHVAQERAHVWFAAEGAASWATCPMTENAVLRIVGHPRYANSPGSIGAVASLMVELKRSPGHQFWSDELSLIGSPIVDAAKIAASKDVTDTYLLGLAVSKGATLATFDRKLSTAAVKGGKAASRVIGS